MYDECPFCGYEGAYFDAFVGRYYCPDCGRYFGTQYYNFFLPRPLIATGIRKFIMR